MSTIGITMGCPSGIGPEIILRYFTEHKPDTAFQPVVLGDCLILEKCAERLGYSVNLSPWLPGSTVPNDAIPVLELSAIRDHAWGRPSKEGATAMVEYIRTAVRLTQEGVLAGLTTCPIAKDALQQAGFNYPGHTEMLAELTGTSRYTMMMAGTSLRVTLATIHCRYSNVPSRLTTESITELIDITHEALRIDFGVPSPRITVAGLNPHAGESGIFGDEEKNIIRPAVQKAVQKGLNVRGPFPPDTVFFKAVEGDADCVVCMYHDQGLIPFKLLHFDNGVNVTLGLPIVRTSVDHGTAYDIAGKGIAKADSLAAAVSLAATIGANRNKFH